MTPNNIPSSFLALDLPRTEYALSLPTTTFTILRSFAALGIIDKYSFSSRPSLTELDHCKLSLHDFSNIFYAITDRVPGRWEEVVLTNIQKLIPDSVERFWHDWRASMKKAEPDVAGSDVVSEGVEMAGWGVEEATAQNKKDASTCPFPFLTSPPPFSLSTFPSSSLRAFSFTTDAHTRPRHAARPRLRDPQVLHLHPRARHGGRDAQGRQGAAQLGLGHRQAHDQGGEGAEEGELAAAEGQEGEEVLEEEGGEVDGRRLLDVGGGRGRGGGREGCERMYDMIGRRVKLGAST